MKKRSGFTLTEILIGLVIIGLMAALIIPRIWGMAHRAGKAEGVANLGAIRSAQLLLHEQIGRFRLADGLSAIQSELSLAIASKFYDYQIVEASEEDFLALAIPIWPHDQWLEELAITKDGFVEPPSTGGGGRRPDRSGGTSGGSEGGTSGGSSGGSGGSGGAGGGAIFTTPDRTSPSIDLDTTPITTLAVPVPTGLQLTSNNEWLTLGWNDAGGAFSYRVYESDSVDGTFVFANAFFNTGSFAAPQWEDNVTNGVTTCYRVTAIGTTTTGQVLESNPSTAVCGQASAASPFSVKANAALTELGNANINITSVDGAPMSDTLSNTLTVDGVPILFGTGPGEGGALATYNPVLDTITIDTSFFASSDEVVASILAHETLHYIWDQDFENFQNGLITAPLLGTPPNPPGGVRSSNSLDQEYRSFLAASQVWFNIRGIMTDVQLDAALNIVLFPDGSLRPEDEAKTRLRLSYPTLPNY
jgi:prepilin-type N-terminal cleavage/methylation domain-containing protein